MTEKEKAIWEWTKYFAAEVDGTIETVGSTSEKFGILVCLDDGTKVHLEVTDVEAR